MQTTCFYVQWLKAKTQPSITFVETRSGAVISFICARKGGYEELTKEILCQFESYGFLNPEIVQCDKEMSIIDVRRKLARERKARTVVRFEPKTIHQGNGFCRSSARAHPGSCTMLPDTNRKEHWHTAFSNISCHPICSSLRRI